MSWIIKINKFKLTKYFILFLLLVVSIISLLFKNILLPITILLALVCYFFNFLINKKIFFESKKFTTSSNIRNINYLIIGDLCDVSCLVPQNSSYIAILAPNRSLNSSFEILRHTYSILDENNATAIIINKSNNIEGFSIFDIPFFNQISINRLNLFKQKLFSKIPLLYSPINSLKFIFGNKRKTLKTSICPNEDLKNFCKIRNIKLIYKIF